MVETPFGALQGVPDSEVYPSLPKRLGDLERVDPSA